MTTAPVIDPAIAQQANAAGMEAMRTHNPAVAVEAFLRATQADPGALPLWSNLAHAQRLLGNNAGERAALEQALAIDRTDFGAQLRMAQLLQRMGEEAGALIAWGAVQMLAAQMPNLSPDIADEIAIGDTYCQTLQQRLDAKIGAVLESSKPDWDETEQRRITAFVNRGLGRRQIYQNQCAGMYYPFLPADEYFDRHHFPWLDKLEAKHAVIKAEFAALIASQDDALRPYVRLDEGTPQNPWSALDGSLDWGACFLWEYGVRNDAVAKHCPQTAALLETLPLAYIPGRAPNAFFSLLRPNSHIPPHTGVTNTRAIIHLALDIPEGCGFRVGAETREWVEGKAFAFDDTIDHEAWNQSDRPRAVLIIDTWNPHLSENEREAVTRYLIAADGALKGAAPIAR